MARLHIPDQTGRTHLVTGANTGIGLATAQGLAQAGARVFVHARNEEKAEAARNKIIDATGNKDVHTFVCDLAVQDEIRSAAAGLVAQIDRLDGLIHNAGVWRREKEHTVDGFEQTIAVNHLAPFLLTHQLLPLLKTSAPARVVNVASQAHRHVSLDPDDPLAQHSGSDWRQYQRSKLMNVLFTRELAKRLEGTGVTANCLHPGVVATDLFRSLPGFLEPVVKLFLITPETGARTSLYLATSPEVQDVSGRYFIRWKPRTPSRAARDDAMARRLWEASCEATSVDRYGQDR
ncbi:MAG: SDR family oxidoreductase [Euryarchaeota archaeon]|nr:SDR family oxidoreductase [Euryarchaeota archaeon]